MATPKLQKGTDYVYIENAWDVPYTVREWRQQNVGRAGDGTLKVYDHGLGGSKKRQWRVKAWMDNAGATYYKFSDFLTFMRTIAVHAKEQISYYDKDGTENTVRILDWSYTTQNFANWLVEIVMEEDF